MEFLKSTLSAIEKAAGIKPVAFSSKSIESLPCVQYQIYKDGDDAVIETWRLTVRVTCETLKSALEVESAISGALVSFADEETNGTLNTVINGGGTIEDEQTGKPQLITYYDITTRKGA